MFELVEKKNDVNKYFKIVLSLMRNDYLDSDVLIGSDDGYGLRNPDGVEYTDGVCLQKNKKIY